MNREAVVTGASGFIGSELCRELIHQGWKVRGVSRRSDFHLEGGESEIVQDYGDVRSSPNAVLFHLAGESNLRVVAENPELERKHSQVTAHRLLASSFKKIVFVSSGAVYGDQSLEPRSESERLSPVQPYGQIKLETEHFFTNAGHAAVRLGNVYGIGMSKSNILSDIFSQLCQSTSLTVRNVTAVRVYIHVSDVGTGLIRVGTSEMNGVFNLGTGKGTSVGDLVRCVLRHASENNRDIRALDAHSSVSQLILSPEKAKSLLGFQAQVSLDSGIQELLKNILFQRG